MKIYGRLAKYAFKYPHLVFLSCLFAITLVGGKIAGAMQAGSFFSSTFIGNNFEKVSLVSILFLTGVLLVWAGSHYLTFISANTLAARVMHDMRRDLYSRLIDLPVAYYKQNRTGEILSRLLNDVSVIEIFFLNILVELIAQPLTVVLIITIMITMNPRISLYFFSIAPVIGIVLGGIGGLVQGLSHKVQKNISDVTAHIQETIYGIEVIKGYAVENVMKDRFFGVNDAHLKATRAEIKIRFLGTPSSEFLGGMAIVLVLVLGAVSVQKGMATSGDIVSFLILAMVLSEPLARSSDIWMVLQKLTPAARRVFEIIDSADREDLSRPDIGTLTGQLDFEQVSFSYDEDRKILHDVSLSVKPGETVAVVGPSGSGKSTLISLVPAFYPVNSGRVLLDGKDINAYNPRSIRSQIALVTQETLLFSGSIRDNISLSRPEATEAEIIQAAELANAHGFISRLPEGYNTVLGDRGTRLSGGERQRVALARAILRRPRILILDEATSALDAESEAQIQKAMENILGRQTTLIVTHKLSTIASADRIAVMEGGKVIETGTHAELMKNEGIYQKLFSLQVVV